MSQVSVMESDSEDNSTCSNLSAMESDAEVSTSLLATESVMEDVESFPELSKKKVCQVCD